MLKSEKVILRALKREDIERMHELNQDKEMHILNGTLQISDFLGVLSEIYVTSQCDSLRKNPEHK